MVSNFKNKVMVEQDVQITMRDDIYLAADIYHPSKNGQLINEKLPALLNRTPYNKRSPDMAEQAALFAKHGYKVIMQDCRGCYGSEGELYFLVNEPFDGYDTIEWIAAQPWSNGKVGTYGTSYMSWVQSAAATQNPPHLTCMFLNMGGWNAHTSSVRQGGTMELRFMSWAFWHAALNQSRSLKKNQTIQKVLDSNDFREWLSRMPIRKGSTGLALVPQYEKWCFDLFTHADYDDYWKQPGFAIEEHLNEHADVPVYLSGGWYDSYTRSTLEAFSALKKTKKSDIRVIMGPWTHGLHTAELTFAGDVDFGHDAALSSFDQLHLRWFNRWLKNDQNGIEKESPVKLFVMGGGSGRKNHDGLLDHGGYWRKELEWSLTRTMYTKFYLNFDGSLTREAPQDKSSNSSYQFDPANPVPTIGGNLSSLMYLEPPRKVSFNVMPSIKMPEVITPAGGFNQYESEQFFGCRPPYLPLAARPDVLVFQTEPLEVDIEITGPINVKLWVSCSTLDSDFTAKLIDVYPPNEDYPNGYVLNLSDGIQRARYRNSREKNELMNPGEKCQLTIILYPISNLFQKGHRIRLDISSSNFPRFDVNPNTGEPIGLSRQKMIAKNTVYHEKEYPSYVILPLL
ncbi:CocE/NonD family hydrolase [Chloroflexota bacterium]